MTNLDDMMLMALANRSTGMPVNVSAEGESLVLAEDGANERPPLRIDIEGVGQQTPPEEVGPPPEEDITAVATEMAAGTEPEGATPMSLGEFATTVADVPAGLVKGAVQGTVGAPADIYSIGRAIYSAANPNPGETRLQAFIRSIGDPVEVFGYDVTTEGIKKIIDGTIGPLVPEGASDRRLEAAKTAETTGEIMALGKMANQIAVGMFKGAQVAARGAETLGTAAVRSITGKPDITPQQIYGAMTDTAGTIKAGAPGVASKAQFMEQFPNTVSTRLPTAKKATEDAMSRELLSDLQTMKRDEAAFQKNMDIVRTYPNFASKVRNPEQAAEVFIDEVKNNLLFLHDAVPDATRQRSKLWYDGARKIVDRWGQEYQQPDQALAGVLAVLSPQKDWFMNVSLGNRVIDIALNQSSHVWDKDMTSVASKIWAAKYKPVINLVKGKSYDELATPGQKALWLRTYDQTYNPRDHRIVTPEGDFGDVRLTKKGQPAKVAWGPLNEIGKAVAILQDPSLETINKMLGSQHKVRNFYNNIYAPGDPAGHVTIDTHAVAAGLLRPLSGKSREVLHNFGNGVKGQGGVANSSVTGSQGTYGLYAEAYRRAAQERGILPREMQSITWEAVRGLFPDTFKNAKNTKQIDDIWVKYRKGQLSLEEARDAVIRTAGGINPPEWESAGGGLRGGAPAAGGNAGNTGELPGAGVPGGSARGPRRNQSASGTTTVKRGQAPAKGAK